jgi:hypothetical protein
MWHGTRGPRLDNAQPWSTIPLGIGRHTPFATQVAALLNYAVQVAQLGRALHTRTDIGSAVGIPMERHASTATEPSPS